MCTIQPIVHAGIEQSVTKLRQKLFRPSIQKDRSLIHVSPHSSVYS